MKKIKLTSLNELFAALAESAKVYLPVDDGKGSASFEQWTEGAKLSTAYNTNRSAKDFFFPQTENLVDFKVDGKKIEVIDSREPAEDFIVFGVRACDVRSFEILDSVYLSEPVDSYYKTRREHGTVISLACSAPDETCFCSAFGIDATAPAGDARAYISGDHLYIEALTEKGEKAVNALGKLAADCDASEVESAVAEASAKLAALPLANLKPADFTQKQLATFNSPEWAELSASCLGCGTCTFVCPTCQCYDIKDFNTGHGIKRFRCWDSCMYSDFTMMAHGTPRNTQLEKFRQRFMHKLVYYPMNNGGTYGCVGCGRCLKKCPISMNIVKVMKKIGEEK